MSLDYTEEKAHKLILIWFLCTVRAHVGQQDCEQLSLEMFQPIINTASLFMVPQADEKRVTCFLCLCVCVWWRLCGPLLQITTELVCSNPLMGCIHKHVEVEQKNQRKKTIKLQKVYDILSCMTVKVWMSDSRVLSHKEM